MIHGMGPDLVTEPEKALEILPVHKLHWRMARRERPKALSIRGSVTPTIDPRTKKQAQMSRS
jgi:hypothetical protein